MADFSNLFNYSSKQNRRIEKVVEEIRKKQKEYEKLELQNFPQITGEFKERLQNGETLDDILVEAYAAIAEAFKKIQKKNFPNDDTRNGYYDEQIKTSLVLSNGDLAQMLTGEGKTYALTLSAYLSALKGEGMHIITSNEYLAERDYNENKELFETMGLSVRYVAQDASFSQKKEGYACDITYATPTTIAFDYLEDNMAVTEEEKVMRGLSSCILDEVDSSLIDEAINPYIISKKSETPSEYYKDANKAVSILRGHVYEESFENVFPNGYDESLDNKEKYDYIGSKKDNTIMLTDRGIYKVNELLKEFKYRNQIEKINGKEIEIEPQEYMSDFIRNALIANFLMDDKIDYLVQEKEIKVINKETGRISVGSSFSRGIQQALEAKEELEISQNMITLNEINQPNLFKLYSSFSGLSGTLSTSKKEFRELYHKNIVEICPRKGMNRIDEETEICETTSLKYDQILKEVQKVKETGQPLLIGTESVEASEEMSKILEEKGIKHRLLNANNPNEEADIIEKAGEIGAITVATNMAGRGTDIKVPKESLEKGGLYILGTNISESRRIDDQLRGRSGRQGNIGKSKFIVSLEDPIFKRHYLPRKLIELKDNLKNKTQKELHHFLQKFQRNIEEDAFNVRKDQNDFESIDAMIREGYDREKEAIRTSKDITKLFLQMVNQNIDKDVKEHMKNEKIEDLKQKYQNYIKEEQIISAKTIKENFQKKLESTYQSMGQEDFERKLKKVMIEASEEIWIDFINQADERKMQARSNCIFTQKKVTDEYLHIRYKEWEEDTTKIQENILQKVEKNFELTKEKQVQKKSPKMEDRMEMMREVTIMLADIGGPSQIKKVENFLLEKNNLISDMDVQIVKNSVHYAQKRYFKQIKEAIQKVQTEKDLMDLQNNIYRDSLRKEDLDLIDVLIKETKNNLVSTSYNSTLKKP